MQRATGNKNHRVVLFPSARCYTLNFERQKQSKRFENAIKLCKGGAAGTIEPRLLRTCFWTLLDVIKTKLSVFHSSLSRFFFFLTPSSKLFVSLFFAQRCSTSKSATELQTVSPFFYEGWLDRWLGRIRRGFSMAPRRCGKVRGAPRQRLRPCTPRKRRAAAASRRRNLPAFYS